MDGPRGYLLNEISQISYMWNYDFTYIWTLKNKMNFKKWKQTNKKKKWKQTHRYREETGGFQRRRGRGIREISERN